MTTPNIVTGRVSNRANSQRTTPSWLKALYAVIAGLIVIVALSVAFVPASDQGLKPCKSEDSTGCYWDADTMGNGRGHDVVSR